RVESSDNEESLGKDASKHGRTDAIDADEEINLVSVHDEMEVDEEVVEEINLVSVHDEMEVDEEVVEVINTAKLIIDVAQVSVAGDKVSAASAATTVSAATTTTATIVDDITLAQALKEMKVQNLRRKSFDEETALKLQAGFDEEERLAREKAEKEQEDNIALIETLDDIQAKIDVDHQLAERLQAQEQEELSIEEKAILFQQLLEKRRKHFAAKRNRGKEKRAGTELAQEITKKQKVEDNKEIVEIKKLMEIILDEENVAIDVIPLAVKSPSIVDWKIHKEGRKSYYQIIRADGKSQMYMIFSHMLKSFDKEDLETLYKLVKAKYESTRPVEDLDLIL
ncbi:hypothetical protein Tco_0015059, partial [Tanacetum coccineum]